MYLALTDEQLELQATLRAYFTDLAALTSIDGSRPDYVRAIKQMGADGWLGIGWPTEYGGHGRGPVDQMIFVEESHWAGVPLPLLTLNSVGPAIMQLGTDEQRERFLPAILRGEVHFSIGYTEPGAGTDLASLQTRAVRDGDEYVINGEKLYTSAIQYADYVWLAARTDPDAAKHKGLSVFIVPVDTPGFSWTPLATMAGEFTSSTFYEDVRVSAANLEERRTPGGLSSPTSSTSNAWPSVRCPASSAASPRCVRGLRRPDWPTGAAWSTRNGCSCTWPGYGLGRSI